MITGNAYIDVDMKDGKGKIVRAAPIIRITDELLFKILDNKDDGKHLFLSGPVEKGSVFTIKDDFGNSFIYVLKEYDLPSLSWIAEWPD
jgi:hypothetical protein